MFKKCFVFKGFSEDFAHYLNKKLKQGGDGSKLGRVPNTERCAELGAALYPEIKHELFAIKLVHPKGKDGLNNENDKKWKSVLNQFLVDDVAVRAMNGGRLDCSWHCLEES